MSTPSVPKADCAAGSSELTTDLQHKSLPGQVHVSVGTGGRTVGVSVGLRVNVGLPGSSVGVTLCGTARTMVARAETMREEKSCIFEMKNKKMRAAKAVERR